MTVTREALPRLYEPIYKRAKKIHVTMQLCNKKDCNACPHRDTKNCYAVIADELSDLARLIKEVANGAKKMD